MTMWYGYIAQKKYKVYTILETVVGKVNSVFFIKFIDDFPANNQNAL